MNDELVPLVHHNRCRSWLSAHLLFDWPELKRDLKSDPSHNDWRSCLPCNRMACDPLSSGIVYFKGKEWY